MEGRLIKILVIKNEEEKGITDNEHNISNTRQNRKKIIKQKTIDQIQITGSNETTC